MCALKKVIKNPASNNYDNLKYIYSQITDKGLVRKENEDNLSFAKTSQGSVFTVCDGMGGHVAGKLASEIAVKSITNYLKNNKNDDITQNLNDAIEFANTKIYRYAEENQQYKGMGTTATLLFLSPKKIYIAHAGDSRIYLLTDKLLHKITKDHSFVQSLVDKGIITEEEAKTDSRKNQITKGLGIKQKVNPTVQNRPILPQKGDIFLLCSDGLTDMVDEINILLTLNDKNLKLEQKAQKLLNRAINAGGIDNITLQLIEITESPYTKTDFISLSSKKLLEKQKKILENL